ncbi:MAG: type transport system ATP-binding protein [Chloroflexota bacterium]|nr:type transport system ATP-binding protein [Chloroflexota bacterium]
MYRRAMLATMVAVLAGVPAAGASAATAPPITASFNDCPVYPGGDHICTGEVPSFNGSMLDVDLTLPSNGGGAKHPLIVMLHGFGNDKHEWESTDDAGDGADKARWNNHWFARHGYYVLNYTARGFRTDKSGATQPETPAGTSEDLKPPCACGTLHVKSRDFEIRDTQWLAALVARSFPGVDPDAIAVTGGSYGGGESWVQASQPTWDFPHEQDPSLPVLQLQVAVPKYPWTDLSYALAPNGHGDPYSSSQGHPDSDTGNGYPTGVPKASYITGLFATGASNGTFESGQTTMPGAEGPVDIPLWNTRLVLGGDPYPDADLVVAQARRGLTEFRSAYYQDKQWDAEAAGRKVAVFSIQGWTDDLFEAVESFRMFKDLKARDPRWPVEVAVADIGHSRAQNKPDTWQRLNAQAFQWLQSNINGSHEQTTTVSSQQTVCDDSAPASRLTATTPEGLSAGTLAVTYAGGAQLTNASGTGDPDGLGTDAIGGGFVDSATGNTRPCAVSRADTWPGRYTGTSEPLPNERTYVGLGTVTAPYTLTGAVAELDARVWDVAPGGGPALLVTRGTYRLDTTTVNDPDPQTGTLRLPLYGNHWRLAPGHRLRLDLAEVDEPTFRRTDTPNTLTLGDPVLTLPTRSAGDGALAGTGG